MPNAYYAKKTLLHFLFNCQPFADLKFFSNSRRKNAKLLEGEEHLGVAYVKSWRGAKAEHFAFFAQEGIHVPKRRPGTETGQYLFVETSHDDPATVEHADAFIFNAFDGVAVFGFRREMDVEPMVLGSNSAEYADGESYTLTGDFRRLECGTPNVPFLLAMRNFYKNR